jgi:hypothetical protein
VRGENLETGRRGFCGVLGGFRGSPLALLSAFWGVCFSAIGASRSRHRDGGRTGAGLPLRPAACGAPGSSTRCMPLRASGAPAA